MLAETEPDTVESKPHVLIISPDLIARKMAGPGIRYFQFACELARHVHTTLAVPNTPDAITLGQAFEVRQYTVQKWDSIRALATEANIIILSPDVASWFPALADVKASRVIDSYDPLWAEWLEIEGWREPDEQARIMGARLTSLLPQFLLGDFFICASERQRDWLLGQLEAYGRITPHVYRRDRSLRNLVDVVPYGIPKTRPVSTGPVIKGKWPGISGSDKLILWGGGLWPWLDPLSAIRAVVKASESRSDLRLVFPGSLHPNPQLEGMKTLLNAARSLATELGVIDKVVYFGDWVPYELWPSVLMESDLALSFDRDTYETHLAYRARILDCIWAGLPVVTTGSDVLSVLVEQNKIGSRISLADGNIEHVTTEMLQWLSLPRALLEPKFARVREALSWEACIAPLVSYCRAWHRQSGTPEMEVIAKNSHKVMVSPEQIMLLENERARLQETIRAIQAGRYMRLMAGLKRFFSPRSK